ncbi:MAG: PIN domain-containing protein [Bythopirellula sp.]|nr:PIN domain-containing protein [Bythopirellula sp.]
MKTVFADSTFYVALVIARDENHPNARVLAQSWTGLVVTTEYVLTEVANHLSSSPRGRASFGQLLADLQADPNTVIVASTHELWERGTDLYLRRPDKEWSLVDCISFVVMEEQGLTNALTADHHFQQAGFVAMLRA